MPYQMSRYRKNVVATRDMDNGYRIASEQTRFKAVQTRRAATRKPLTGRKTRVKGIVIYR